MGDQDHGIYPSFPPDTLPAGYQLGLKGRPFVSQVPVSHLHMLISTISTRFYGICPFSLVEGPRCTVPTCRLLQLCEVYNEKGMPGCERGNWCGDVHEFRTCRDEAEGIPCSWNVAVTGEKCEKKREHTRMMVHKRFCDKDEWLNRETVARLRNAHVLGWY